MPRILRTEQNSIEQDSGPRPDRSIGRVFVNNKQYNNSAAKFWYGLAEEISTDFPDCTDIELLSKASGQLNQGLLHPVLNLEHEIEHLLFRDLSAEIKNTIAELEIFGPPSAVHIRLLSHGHEIVSRDLPLDIIDSEIFPCLVVWPLEWAGIPEASWNKETIEGNIRIENRKHAKIFNISFSLETKHISEGLLQRCFRQKQT